jgi:hypothetical protein
MFRWVSASPRRLLGMGTFSATLYGSDFALDLRPAIGAVLRLPVREAELVEHLCSAEPGPSRDPNDPDRRRCRRKGWHHSPHHRRR